MSGLFVTGHVRSGTSMVAGLFAEHGVFFGECAGPSRINAKGFFENRWLKRTMHAASQGEDWPDPWFDRLLAEGWDGHTTWGAKLMPKWWPHVRPMAPTVIVRCYRDADAVLASSRAVGWKRSHETIIERHHLMDAIYSEARDDGACVWSIYTPDLVAGMYDTIEPAFDALGLAFHTPVARAWIDPRLWHH